MLSCLSLMRPFRLLALAMAVVLLTVRLGSFTEEVFVTPIEDAIFDVAFVSAEDDGRPTKPPALKTKRVFDGLVVPLALPVPPARQLIVAHIPAPEGHLPIGVPPEIFIPPEAGC